MLSEVGHAKSMTCGKTNDSGSGTAVVMAPGWHIDKRRHGQ